VTSAHTCAYMTLALDHCTPWQNSSDLFFPLTICVLQHLSCSALTRWYPRRYPRSFAGTSCTFRLSSVASVGYTLAGTAQMSWTSALL
jgi:hypothetical protein